MLNDVDSGGARRCVELIEAGEPVAAHRRGSGRGPAGTALRARVAARRAPSSRLPDPPPRGSRGLRPGRRAVPVCPSCRRHDPQDARLPDRRPVRADRRAASACRRRLRSPRHMHPVAALDGLNSRDADVAPSARSAPSLGGFGSCAAGTADPTVVDAVSHRSSSSRCRPPSRATRSIDAGHLRELLDAAAQRWPEITDRKALLLRLAEEGQPPARRRAARHRGARRRARVALERIPSLVDTERLLSDRAWS